MKTTTYFRDVASQKHPGIEAAWILRVLDEPLEDRETIHNAFFDRGFLRALNRQQPFSPAAPPAP